MVLSIICSKFKNEDEKVFKEELIEILKILGLIENIKLLEKYGRRKHSQKFRLKI